MKICFITTVCGTLRSFVLPQVENLKHNHPDWDYAFICSYDEDFENSLPEYIDYIPVNMTRGVNLKDIKNVFILKRIFNKNKYDMIVYSTPNAAFFASVAGKLANVPLRLYNQWGIRYITFKGVKKIVFKTLERITCLFSTHVKSVSFKNRDFAINEGLCKKNKISVIGIGGTVGVDFNEFDITKKEIYRKEIREKYNISAKDFVFGFVGRLNVDKGINELIEAFKEIENAKLVLVGKIDDNYGPNKNNIEFAKNNANIIMTGNVPSSEVVKYLACFDILVHPTYREGFGKVLQESMAMRCPIITTDIPGPSEVIENDISGILIPAQDRVALKCEMLKLMNDSQRRERYAIAGRKRVEEYFERSIMLQNILVEYNRLLDIE